MLRALEVNLLRVQEPHCLKRRLVLAVSGAALPKVDRGLALKGPWAMCGPEAS